MRRIVASHSVENDLARQAVCTLRLASHRLFRFVLPVQLHGLCSDRTSGRHGVAFEAHDSLDKGWSVGLAAHRVHDVCPDELLSVVALDLA